MTETTGRRSTGPGLLVLRFLLELAALAGWGFGAFQLTPAPWRFVLVAAVPLAVAAAWGTFATPGDPTRSGRTVVATPGPARLALELAVLFGGSAALYAGGAPAAGLAFAAVLVAYHLVAFDRVSWLLRRPAGQDGTHGD